MPPAPSRPTISCEPSRAPGASAISIRSRNPLTQLVEPVHHDNYVPVRWLIADDRIDDAKDALSVGHHVRITSREGTGFDASALRKCFRLTEFKTRLRAYSGRVTVDQARVHNQ